jgi:uncharacterized PurR-regulated membrane protein YhhQ (DUF165 family)
MNFLKFIRDNRKGITGLVIGMVTVLIACAILVPIGLLVASNLQTSMPALTGSANTTAYAVYNNVYSAFSLSAVVPIVAAAGVIISIIVGVFAWKRGQ